MSAFEGEIHPFLADLPVFDSEVESITDSIREVGLLHPITLDLEGRLIGGRHRLAACDRAGVEPSFETYDGDVLAFVLHDNAIRKHQSTAQRAAETALSLASAECRIGGRWKRGTVTNPEIGISKTEQNLLAQVGVILDYLGRDVLVAVATGERVLNEAHSEACEVRDQQLRKAEQERQAVEAESKAERLLIEADPELYALVPDVHLTYLEAEAVWKVRNAEEAEKRARAQREDRDRKAAIERGIQDELGHISNAIEFLAKTSAETFVKSVFPHRGRHATRSRCLTETDVDAAIDYLTTLRKAF